MAALSAVVLTVGRVNENVLLIGAFPPVLLFANVLVMIVSYSLMIVTVVLNLKAAHKSVDVANVTPTPGPCTVPQSEALQAGDMSPLVAICFDRHVFRTSKNQFLYFF